jgi:hypothetical protein
MIRRTVLVALIVVVAGALAPAPGIACGNPEIEKSVEKLDNGVRCTLRVKGDADVAALREHVRSCAGSHTEEGVKIAFEEIEGGIIVSRTADDPELAKKLQARAEAWIKGTCSKKACPHAKKGCSHAKTKKGSSHAKTKKGCSHAKTKEGCPHAKAAHGCSKKSAKKSCPHHG